MATYPRNVVVVGAGVAGLRTIETLRADGYDGSIALVSAESEEPYNLPPLSKEFLTGSLDEDDIRLSKFAELEDLDVELVFNSPATALDASARVLQTARGAVPFDCLVIATGSTPTYPDSWPILDGVVGLRTLADARKLRDAMRHGTPRVAIIGGGFIGCEVACSARYYGLDTTIIEGAQHILSRAMDSELAETVTRLHVEHGVRVSCGRSVRTILGSGRVEAVELNDGTRIDADLVVVGIGARPNVDWLLGTPIDLSDGVVVDATLQSSVPGVYAVGDVARWSTADSGDSRRVEHWTNAQEQGALVARNLLHPAGAEPFSAVPYVWSDMYGQRLQVIGTRVSATRFLMGEPGGDQYLAAWVEDERIVGGIGFGVTKPFSKLRRLVVNNAAWSDVSSTFGTPLGDAPNATTVHTTG